MTTLSISAMLAADTLTQQLKPFAVVALHTKVGVLN